MQNEFMFDQSAVEQNSKNIRSNPFFSSIDPRIIENFN
jgi:hypothetical protein